MVSMLASELDTSSGLRMLHLAPLTHGSGSKLIAVLARGGTNILTSQFEPDELPAIVAATAPTHTFLVPTMIDRIVRTGEAAQRAASTFTQISFGGSPIAPASFVAAIEAIGPIFTQVYGSCEAPHPITLLRPADTEGLEEHVLLSAGRAADGVAVRLADVSDDGAGELEVNSAHLMHGYWRNDEATEDVFTGDGWYRTGDLASISGDGLVTFQDRKRDLIISGGLNIYPSEVERAIAAHPGVQDVVVVGYPDPDWGESVMAFVVCEPPDSLSAEDVVATCRDRIAGYKKPRRVEFLDQMPLGASNKVLRQALRDRLWEGEQRRIG
jgi:acyl-CoA synthetase (AMP-forming)/AMP-acid ligase II